MATKSIEPRADGEGSIGSTAYRWATAFISGILSNGTESKTIKQIADHIDASAPHTGHPDLSDDPFVIPNETQVPNLLVGDEGIIWLRSDKSAYITIDEQSNGDCHIQFWDTNRDAVNPIFEF